MRFIDLFAGLGGFHTGILNTGEHECVFACEIDESLQELYKQNYGILPMGDITKIDIAKIPKHDLLCAGFPCQPFSLAGKKNGRGCPESGKLIYNVMKIIRHHTPRFVLLENVPNLLKIDRGKVWAYIESALNSAGYQLNFKIFSPVEFGIPQNRKRLFAIAFRNKKDAKKFEWPKPEKNISPKLSSLLIDGIGHRKLERRKQLQLKHWQKLLSHLGANKLKATPILAQEFGATYPENFMYLSLAEMQNWKGAYGQKLESCNTWKDALPLLPSYTRKSRIVPEWLQPAINYSRSMYLENKKYIDDWKKDIDKNNNSWQAIEWRGYSDNVNLKNHLIQFRPSGIRISKSDIAPSLTSMTPTQIPIIGKNMRYLSKQEAARLQNLQSLGTMPEQNTRAFRALGNAVNAKIVELIVCNIC